MTNLPPAPPSKQPGSFWRLGERDLNVWDIGVKVLVWGSVLGVALWFAFQ